MLKVPHITLSSYDAIFNVHDIFYSNGYVLYAAEKAVPQEHYRVLSGTSVAEPGAVYDEESGRMYHNHGTGRYFFPNDPVSNGRRSPMHKHHDFVPLTIHF